MKKRLTFYSIGLMFIACACLGVGACGPNAQKRAEIAEQKRVECLDKFCPGDVEPSHDMTTEVALKLNGQWFIGPREYFSNQGVASFEWWEHKALRPSLPRPSEVQRLAIDGKGYDFSIGVFFRSNHIPPMPHGYRLIELAEKNRWIESRKTIRVGLDAITMKHVIGPNDQYSDHLTYYAATHLRGIDGLPPVASCNHDHPRNSGGTGFMWRDGIYVGVGMNQKHCTDWPEIYQEITHVLALLKKV